MEITEVRVKLVEGKQQDKLKAFCSITIDDAFVIRDLKIIEGAKGLFVAMPSRKITTRCDGCGGKNQIGARYCSQCGSSQPPEKGGRGRDGRLKLHADIAHPINSRCRDSIQTRVLQSFEEETFESTQPGYQPPTFDDYGEETAAEEPAQDRPSRIDVSRLESGRSEKPGRAAASLRDSSDLNESKRGEPRPSESRKPADFQKRAESSDSKGQGDLRKHDSRERRDSRLPSDSGGSGRSEVTGRPDSRNRDDSDRRRDSSPRREDARPKREPGRSRREERPQTAQSEKVELRPRKRNLGFDKENRYPREKSVETNNPPPDDNFGAGLF